MINSNFSPNFGNSATKASKFNFQPGSLPRRLAQTHACNRPTIDSKTILVRFGAVELGSSRRRPTVDRK